MTKITLLFSSFITISFTVSSQVSRDSMVTTLEKVIVEKKSGSYVTKNLSGSLRLTNGIAETPQNIQVINDDIISYQQLFDLSDNVTKNVSGAGSSFRENWGNYANIFMRGASVTPFRNGMNVKMPWGPLTEDLCMVEKIEFVKGPAGFMFGNGEASGLYNVVTKKPTGRSGGEMKLTTGSFDTYRATLDLDGKVRKDGTLLYRVNLAGTTRNAHRDFDFNNRFSISPVLKWIVDNKTSLTAEYTYQYMKMAMLGSAYLFSLEMADLPANFSMLEPNLEPTVINDQSVYVTLDHEIDRSWNLTSRVSFFKYNQEGSSIWPAYPVGLEQNGNLTRSIANWDAFNESRQAQSYINGKFTVGHVRNALLAGIDLSYKNYYADFYQASTITGHDIYGNSVPFNIYSPAHAPVPVSALPRFDRSVPLRNRGGGTMGESSVSAYVMNEMTLLNERLRITAGARFTKLKQHSFGVYSNDEKISPRTGVNYKVNANTYVYMLFDQSFMAQQGMDSAGKPFVPVFANNIEAGVKNDFMNGKLTSTFTVYQVIRNNMISVIPGPTYKAVQTGQTKTKGIELDIKGEIATNVNIIMNYAYTRAKITKDDDKSKIGSNVEGAVFPQHITNTWINYRLSKGKAKGLSAGVGYQVQASRPNGLPVYERVDAAASLPLGKLIFALNLYNLLDKYLYSGAPYEYNNDPSSTEYYFQVEPGINFRFAVSYRF